MISKSFLNLDLNESNTKLYNDDKEKLIKKQRRSRHCQEGRQFKCEKCNKSYLSKPALLNHMFKKHKDILNENLIKKKRRGRPKNFEIIENQKEESKNKNYHSFFLLPKRKLLSNQIISNNYENAVNIAFQIYINFNHNKYFRYFKYPKDNPILNNLLNKNDLFFPVCDEIFTEYLMNVHSLTNENYFIFILKFILLFRESINLKMIHEKKYSIKEYTSSECAKLIPDFCNNFFSNYLVENYFGFNDSDIDEFINLVQHLCRWLLIKNYTTLNLDFHN